MLVSALWIDSASNDAMNTAAQGLMTSINQVAKGMDLLHMFQYANYAGPSQDPMWSYGSQNLQRLREVSRKYDPQSVFQRQVPGGFKLVPKF